uniref:glycosyltransferase family A protein n=2 Tax=Gelidibacter sp. TaxID=2018083 RepID=UPI00404A0A03
MFNIITPTYNRKHLLHRVYESLKSQTLKDFKWIIVDDCSSDDTKTLVNEWQSESNSFMIEYYYLEKNQGKPNAVNFGLKKCDRPYTIIADSDDEFSNQTLLELKLIWDVIELKDNNIAAIWTLDLDENNQIIGDKFPKDFWQVSFYERVLNNKKQISGDKWHCWKTQVLKANQLYSDTESHIEESQTWDKINREYDFLCINISHLKVYKTPNSLITSQKTRYQISRSEYYSAYYGLIDISLIDIIKHKHFRSLAFNYVKSKFFYSDKKLKLSKYQYFVSIIIFLINAPYRILNKLV